MKPCLNYPEKNQPLKYHYYVIYDKYNYYKYDDLAPIQSNKT